MPQPLVTLFIIAVFIMGGLLYIFNPEPTQYQNPKKEAACTLEAKLCPDGSYVGRVPPNCEFQECPATSTPVFEDQSE